MGNPLANLSFKKTAQAVAKVAKQEIVEVGRSAGRQATGNEQFGVKSDQRESPIIEAMRQGTQNVSETERQGIASHEQRTLHYLQDELDALKRKVEMEGQQKVYDEAELEKHKQEQIVIANQNAVAMPSSGHQKGARGQQKQKQNSGTKELTKPPSG